MKYGKNVIVCQPGSANILGQLFPLLQTRI